MAQQCAHGIRFQTCSLCDTDQVFRAYERRAKRSNLPFKLTAEEFRQIVLKPCAYCGELGQPRGIDRKDNARGYVPENCQPCCGPCNFLKGRFSHFEFLGRVMKIARYQESQSKRSTNETKDNYRTDATGASGTPRGMAYSQSEVPR